MLAVCSGLDDVRDDEQERMGKRAATVQTHASA